MLLTYDVEGEHKVTAVVADAAATRGGAVVSDGWVVETFATCDPSEYAPSGDDERPPDGIDQPRR